MNEEIKNYMSSLNFDETCRTCLSESDEMTSLFAEIESPEYDEDISFLYQIFMNVASIQATVNDGLPTLICRNCIENANNALKFKIQCERSESLLQAYNAHVRVKDEIDKDMDDVKIKEQDSFEDGEYLNDSKTATSNNHVQKEKDTSSEVEEKPIVIMEEAVKNQDDKLEVTENKTEVEAIQEIIIQPEIEVTLSTADSANLEKDISSVQLSAENLRLRERITLKKLKTTYNRSSRKSYYSYTINEKGEKVYACSYCEKQYKHGTSLTVHMRSHTHDRPYLCTLCGKDFKQLTGLSYHMRTHSGEQPYACNLCEKRYRQSASLTAHMRVHTGQRPFLCSVCGKGFRQAPDLSYHMRTHTKEKPYMCNVCGKRMSMQCHLVQHLRTHTGEKPFVCKECGKAFASTTRLKRHEIIHTGLKPFECDVCKKAFNRSSTLRVHAMIHTDERPHQCQVCGKGFIQAHCLRSHLKTHF